MSEPEYENPGDHDITTLLTTVRRIAVVGASDNPSRASHEVAEYLMKQGYEIVPVNPQYERVPYCGLTGTIS